MSKKRTLSMGSDADEEEGYDLDLTPTEDVDTPKEVMVKKKSPERDRKEFSEEDVPDFATYEDAVKFMKDNRLKYA